jgi:hypothetical protein
LKKDNIFTFRQIKRSRDPVRELCHWDYLLKEMVSSVKVNTRNGCSRILSRKGDGKLIWLKLSVDGYYSILRLEAGSFKKMYHFLLKIGITLE